MLKIPTSSSGAIRLSKDFAKLVNNPVGSDIRFLVGGGETTPSSGLVNEEQNIPAATFYGHSLILRFRSKYFATLYENEWKERSDGIFKKPNVSPVTFHALLYYVYTGSVETVDSSLLPELIAIAEEMELDELSIICQSRLTKELKISFENTNGKDGDPEDKNDDDDDDGDDQNSERKRHKTGKFSFSLAIHTLLIPAFIVAYGHTLESFYKWLLDFTLFYIKTILASTSSSIFLENIPIAIFKQILTADSLCLAEYDIWQLALSWACQKTRLLKPIVEAQIRLMADIEIYKDTYMEGESISSNSNEESDKVDQPLIPEKQLNDLKSEIQHLLPTIRFTLMKPDEYLQAIPIFNFFLPSRRLLELQRFFSKPGTTSQEVSRTKSSIFGITSKIVNLESGELLKKWIHESKGISSCSSPMDIKFELLYRVSTHGPQPSIFHSRCDNRGPTLVLVRSSDGHVFGGVNFKDWVSVTSPSPSMHQANFLFALRDGKYRDKPAKFPWDSGNYSAYNNSVHGPIFGSSDLRIIDGTSGTSKLPQFYNGKYASNTTLAGAPSFTIEDYEVFAISIVQGYIYVYDI